MTAIWLGYLALLAFGIASLVAVGLLIARRTGRARITFAAGVLVTAVIAALAGLSFLTRGQGFYEEGSEPAIAFTALTFLLAGAGQFVAAFHGSRTYAAALACAAGSLGLLAAPLLGGDAGAQIPGVRFLVAVGLISWPWASLLLAVLSLMVAVLPPRRRPVALAYTALGGLGAIAGFGLAESCVRTHCTLIQGFPGGGPQEVRVEVDVLGLRVSDETGFAPIPGEGLSSVRAVSLSQAAWVYGPLAAGVAGGAVVGSVTAWGIARLLVGQSENCVQAETGVVPGRGGG
jgi:hypothetical protein